MKLSIGRWGFGLEVGGLVLWLFLGDIYLRCPRIGELAWNSTGFHVNRLPNSSSSDSKP